MHIILERMSAVGPVPKLYVRCAPQHLEQAIQYVGDTPEGRAHITLDSNAPPGMLYLSNEPL